MIPLTGYPGPGVGVGVGVGFDIVVRRGVTAASGDDPGMEADFAIAIVIQGNMTMKRIHIHPVSNILDNTSGFLRRMS
jgi:hypothetical protein